MKKIPMRKCVVTQAQFPKKELLRVVLTPEGEIIVDTTGRANGRGAYLSLTNETLEKAIQSRALDRALKTKVPVELYETLKTYVK